METALPTVNNLALAVDWLERIIQQRLADPDKGDLVAPPSFQPSQDAFTHLIRTYEPTYAELAILVLALTPHLLGSHLDTVINAHLDGPSDLTLAGAVRGEQFRGILPTGETAVWLLAGTDLDARAHVMRTFRPTHWFNRDRVLRLERVRDGEPLLSGRLLVDPELVEMLVHGSISPPSFSADFPAEHLTTALAWDDLVLPRSTKQQIDEILHWIAWNETVMRDWGMQHRIKPGYRAIFHGPPGTGKTLAATLLGQHTGREVFRIDLSRIVSKYIGETEKNLASLFDRAEHKRWILFFDEADALFGKRTDIRDAHDKYANQEVAYLLQRIEGYHGLVILATNQRGNIDEAFVRRFQSIVHFPMPSADERLAIWTRNIPLQLTVGDDVNLAGVAARYEISGAAIMNIIHHCAIASLADGKPTLTRERLEGAIHREFVKEGKVI